MNVVLVCVGLWFVFIALAMYNHWRDGVYD